MLEALCPCGSGQTLQNCCDPFHQGRALPSSGEAMVRSRYSAFCLGRYEYVVETTHPDFRDDLDIAEMRENMQDIHWQKLDIQSSGTATGDDADTVFDTVTFSVLYERQGRSYQMSETSYFSRDGDKMYYVEGLSHRPLGYRRPSPKVGRNDPCPCGSGKKYKKCCASGEASSI